MEDHRVLKEAPDHHDADLVLKIYDLRREAVMRESRSAINAKYWPRSAEEAIAVTVSDHPLNTAFRQTAGYWEMVYGMARHGIVHPDFLVENNGESCLWVAGNCLAGTTLIESFRSRVRQMLDRQ